jgi:hypothetical protein
MALFLLAGNVRAETTEISEVTRHAQFIEVIKSLAAAERLDDADEVARLLRAKFTSEHSDNSDYYTKHQLPGECKSSLYVKNSYTDFYHTDSDAWFKMTPEGKKRLENYREKNRKWEEENAAFPLLAAMWNWLVRPAETEFNKKRFETRMGYFITRTTRCSPHHAGLLVTRTEIDFNNLPGFVCLNEADLKAAFPQGHAVPGQHGGRYFEFYGVTTEKTGALFEFSSFGDCYGGPRIEYDERYSLGAKRASVEQNACLAKRRAEHPSQKNNDFDFCGTWSSRMDEK